MGWVSDGWSWLDANSRQIGAVGSIVFGLSSAAVAWFAFRLNYRNNFGWRPLLLVIAWGIRYAEPSALTCNFELWNRRKYPVMVRRVLVKLGEAKVDGEVSVEQGGAGIWQTTDDGRMYCTEPFSIEPGKHLAFNLVGDVHENESELEKAYSVEVWAEIFDPRTKDTVVLYGVRSSLQYLKVARRTVLLKQWKLYWRWKEEMPPVNSWGPRLLSGEPSFKRREPSDPIGRSSKH
jgi:hypothetical protein